MIKRAVKTASEIEKSVAKYFSPQSCSVEIALCGEVADAIITYYDFKPTSVVVKELYQLFPFLRISEIHRIYSAEAQMSVLRQLADEDIRVYVPYDDGSLRPLRMGEIIEERLFNREINL